MSCCICSEPALLRFDTVALAKAGDSSSACFADFCSHECVTHSYNCGQWSGVFECPMCKQHVFAADPKTRASNWFWKSNASCCLACYTAKTLRCGQTLNGVLEGDHLVNDSRLSGWLRPDVLTAAGYRIQKMPDAGSMIFTVERLLENMAAHVIFIEFSGAFIPADRPPPTVYARPNGKRARAAALLLCAAHRFDMGSVLASLPRDVVRLLAQTAWGTRFDPKWLYFK